jgi:hypothetical protein
MKGIFHHDLIEAGSKWKIFSEKWEHAIRMPVTLYIPAISKFSTPILLTKKIPSPIISGYYFSMGNFFQKFPQK